MDKNIRRHLYQYAMKSQIQKSEDSGARPAMKLEHMKQLILWSFVGLLLLSCNGNKTISEEEKPQIVAALNEIMELDQKYAGIPSNELREKYGNQKAWEIFKKQRDSIGLLNQNRIKKLYSKYGYLGEQKVGEEAATDFWVVIQHADNDIPFQQEMLKAMETEIAKGSKDKYHYAMLEDRINVNLNKPQRFGSQVTYNDLGQAIPKNGLVDSTAVDSLRKAHSMPDFIEYYNQMTEMHFEMNKQLFLDKGISEPQLYGN